MIVYDVKCAKEHVFEGWFRSSDDFEKQAKGRKIACPECGSTKVSRAPMAPAVKTTRELSNDEARQARTKAREMLVKLREQVEKNADYVGDKFSEEARKIHYGETEQRSIYGEATSEEAQALQEEGVEFGVVPWVDRGDA